MKIKKGTFITKLQPAPQPVDVPAKIKQVSNDQHKAVLSVSNVDSGPI